MWCARLISTIFKSAAIYRGVPMPARKAFFTVLITFSFLDIAVAQEPFAVSQGVIDKVDRDALRLRLQAENGLPGRFIDLKLDRHSRLLSVVLAKDRDAEAIPPRTLSWKSLRPGQSLAVIYKPGDSVVIAAVGQGLDREIETPAADAITSSPRVPEKVQKVLRHIDKTGEAPDGYEGGRTFLNLGRNGEESLPRRDTRGRPITYREWDVNPHIAGRNRGAERLVTGSDGSAYCTADHYRTFTKIR
jgi:guanyl-specific ribonuclease Sa